MITKYPNHCSGMKSDDFFPEKESYTEIYLHQLRLLFENDNYIPYSQYLRTDVWKTRRLEILDRDNFTCQHCGGYETITSKFMLVSGSTTRIEGILEWSDALSINWMDSKGLSRISVLVKPSQPLPDKSYKLHIHHKKYILNRLPWDYEDKDLITLCNHCHFQVHDESKIPVFSEDGRKLAEYINCERCHGTGNIPEYKHVSGGRCFLCNGSGFNLPVFTCKV